MVRVDGKEDGGGGRAESTAAAAPVVKKPMRFVVKDLDAEDVVPGLSRLSIADRRTDTGSSGSTKDKTTTSSSHRMGGGAGGDDNHNNNTNSGPVASRTRGKEREREAGGRGEAPPRPASAGGWARSAAATPVKPSSGRPLSSSSPSPTLSRYGVTLDFEPPSDQDVLAHGLHLAWESGDDEDAAAAATTRMEEQEREALVRPWTEVGALISWLPEGCGAVAMFCSIPTVQRAARKLSSGAGVRVHAAPLLSCDPEIQRQALACGLVIPARPKSDTAAASRLIVGALGMRSPSSSRSPVGETTPQGTMERRTPVTRSQAAAKSKAEGSRDREEGDGVGDGIGRGNGDPSPPPTTTTTTITTSTTRR